MHQRQSKAWLGLTGNSTTALGTSPCTHRKQPRGLPVSKATSQLHPELHTGLEETQNALKDKGNASRLAAHVACQLSACSRSELTEKDVLAGLDADLKGGGWTSHRFVSHTNSGQKHMHGAHRSHPTAFPTILTALGPGARPPAEAYSFTHEPS